MGVSFIPHETLTLSSRGEYHGEEGKKLTSKSNQINLILNEVNSFLL